MFELKELIENCTHIQVQKPISATKVRGNLGVLEYVNEKKVFVGKYGNAVILKTKIKDYKENQ